MTDLLELADRCEKATGPDRRIDYEIFCYMAELENFNFWDPKEGHQYTKSIDAAMALVPEGYAIERMTMWHGCPAEVFIFGTARRSFGKSGEIAWVHERSDGRWKAETPTLALALCAAALRARAATPAQSSKGE